MELWAMGGGRQVDSSFVVHRDPLSVNHPLATCPETP